MGTLPKLVLTLPVLAMFVEFTVVAAGLGVRYLIPLLPFVYLIAGLGLAALLRTASVWTRGAGVVLCLRVADRGCRRHLPRSPGVLQRDGVREHAVDDRPRRRHPVRPFVARRPQRGLGPGAQAAEDVAGSARRADVPSASRTLDRCRPTRTASAARSIRRR